MSCKTVQTDWPNGFKAGDAVMHQSRPGHVVAIPSGIISEGRVPVMYDDEAGCFVNIPADDLDRRF